MSELPEAKNLPKPKPNERSHWSTFVFWLPGFLALIALDQYTKYLAFHSSWASWLDALSPVVSKFPFLNSRFAFSLPVPIPVMYVLYAAVLAFAVYYFAANFRRLTVWTLAGFALIFAGAASNIGERITDGSVRDFIYLLSGIFNLADAFIVLGIIILLFSSGLNKD